MNKLQKVILAAAIIFAPSTAAVAAVQSGPYFAVGAGIDWMPDTDINIDVTSAGHTTSFPSSSKWKTGWGILFAGGYKWDFGLRTEVEYTFREDKVSAFGSSPWVGTQWDNSLMVNALYDISTGTPFTPYIGGGIGGTHVSWGDNFRPTANTVTYDASQVKFGWQGIVGVSYAVTPRMDITADFRVHGASNYSFPANVPGIVANKFDYITQTVFAGIRYAFD